MRLRALRWSIAFTLAMGAGSAGVGLHHSSLRAVLRDIARSAAAPVQAASAAVHSGDDVTGRAHNRAAAADVAPGPATMLGAGLVLLAVVGGGLRRVLVAVRGARSPRAPPGRS